MLAGVACSQAPFFPDDLEQMCLSPAPLDGSQPHPHPGQVSSSLSLLYHADFLGRFISFPPN